MNNTKTTAPNETLEERIIKPLFSEISSLKESHPEYFAYFDDMDPDTSPRAELVDLIASAPNDKVKFFLFGKFMMRLTIASVTGREFK